MADRQEKQIHKQHKLTLISMVALVAGRRSLHIAPFCLSTPP